MKYCLNIEDRWGRNSHRYSKDRGWIPCDNPASISENDFITTDEEAILDLQRANLEIEIDGQEYVVRPSEYDIHIYQDKLYYQAYGFHKTVPPIPSREQLIDVLKRGDDSKDNTLLLLNDGFYKLVPPDSIMHPSRPEIVLQYEAFTGRRYVGASLDAAKDAAYFDRYYHTGLKFWRDHLVDKKLHKQTDVIEKLPEEELKEVLAEIKSYMK